MSTSGILIEVPGAGSGTVSVEDGQYPSGFDLGGHSIFGPSYRETTNVQMVEPLGGINPLTGGGNTSLVELGKRLLIASRDGNVDEVAQLVRKGAPFTNDWLGTSPIHLASQTGCPKTVEVLLRSGNAKDSRTKVDKTPLHIASADGHADVVELLLKNGADIEARDMLKMTPLHWAVERGNLNAVEMLLRYGADPNSLSKFDKSSLEIASDNGRPDIFEMLQNAESFRAMGIDTHLSDARTMAATNSILEHSNVNVLGGDPFPMHNDLGLKTNPNSAAMKLFEAHGIKMLPGGSGPRALESNMASGSNTFTLTEAGKRALNLPPGAITVQRQVKVGVPATSGPKTVTKRLITTAANGQKVTKVIKLDGSTKPFPGGGIVRTESGKKIFISAEQVQKIKERSRLLASQNALNKSTISNVVRAVPSTSGTQLQTQPTTSGGVVKKTVKIIRVNSQSTAKGLGGTPLVVRPSPSTISGIGAGGKPTIITVNSAKLAKPTLTTSTAMGNVTILPASSSAASSGVTLAAASAQNASNGNDAQALELKRKLDEALKQLAKMSEENKELKKLKTTE